MEQVEGGDLVVNKGFESKPREKGASSERNMNPVDGMDAAFKLAEVWDQHFIFDYGLTIPFRLTYKSSSSQIQRKKTRALRRYRILLAIHPSIFGCNLTMQAFLCLVKRSHRKLQRSRHIFSSCCISQTRTTSWCTRL